MMAAAPHPRRAPTIMRSPVHSTSRVNESDSQFSQLVSNGTYWLMVDVEVLPKPLCSLVARCFRIRRRADDVARQTSQFLGESRDRSGLVFQMPDLIPHGVRNSIRKVSQHLSDHAAARIRSARWKSKLFAETGIVASIRAFAKGLRGHPGVCLQRLRESRHHLV